MQPMLRWLNARAENVAAAMLAAMFLTFILQIFSRYVMSAPLGWTLELCLTLWIWIVFWGNAFVVRHKDHVTFDILYLSVRPGIRRIFALISAGAIAIGLGVSLLPTWDYIDFLKIKKSATLKIPMRTIFSIYAIFIIAVVIRYAWMFVNVLRNGAEDTHHHLEITDE
ncbi:TRAP transporter small permease [Actibacterium lipolyticum]|uniref:TRAP transporter small permease protein n=1 Tax=Actibacterium lipolyticum TaxID=1524263 RepID=A0A238KPE5_9RHOB|nr:TRAP transporter small permease subunit [Actibacterium lipolyticum]SMX44709.1 Sialic acid TRAP transporter permease protein SiaT [Actibacterium lipolyticum]